jgi:uncharacterized Tic20 family protein
MSASQLAIYRRKKGLTQEQLAELSGVTTRTIQRIEKGAVVPHIQTLKMLADCLDIETALLMDAPEGNTQTKPKVKTTSIIPLFHLLALLGLGFPILNIVLPFALWILKKEEDPEFDRQGKQVLNFHLTLTILFFPAIVLMVFYFPVGFPIVVATYAFMVIITLINLFRSIKLLPISYPLAYPFFKTGPTF